MIIKPRKMSLPRAYIIKESAYTKALVSAVLSFRTNICRAESRGQDIATHVGEEDLSPVRRTNWHLLWLTGNVCVLPTRKASKFVKIYLNVDSRSGTNPISLNLLPT